MSTERHPARTITENKNIPGQCQGRGMRQIQLPEPHDDILADGTLAGLVDTGVHMPERIGLRHDILLHGPIIDCTQYPHIKRDGIADNAPAPEPVVILPTSRSSTSEKGNVPSAQEIGETPECPPVVARRPPTFRSPRALRPAFRHRRARCSAGTRGTDRQHPLSEYPPAGIRNPG